MSNIVDAITNRNIKSIINGLSGEDIFNKISKEKDIKEKLLKIIAGLSDKADYSI